jgi:hypothetical protein
MEMDFIESQRRMRRTDIDDGETVAVPDVPLFRRSPGKTATPGESAE